MGYYSTSIICKNGHLISGNSNGDISIIRHCSNCGAETISSCPSCNTPIRGKYKADGVFDLTPYRYVPKYCINCGEPYPWTKSALDSAKILINEDDNLDSDEKQLFSETLPDLIVDTPTPKTQVAVVRFKKLLGKVASSTASGIKDIIVDVASESIKKSLGL